MDTHNAATVANAASTPRAVASTPRLTRSERKSLATIDPDAECVVLVSRETPREEINAICDREILLASF